jgi:hypothetical protein
MNGAGDDGMFFRSPAYVHRSIVDTNENFTSSTIDPVHQIDLDTSFNVVGLVD